MQIVGGDGEEHKKMFYRFVLVSFHLNKGKTLGWGSVDISARLRWEVAAASFFALCFSAMEFRKTSCGELLALLHIGVEFD